MARFNKLEDIEVWQEACRLAVEVCRVTAAKRFNCYPRLRDQLQGSAISIPSNIAEGFESQSKQEFIRFLYYAKRSAGELMTQVYIAKKLNLLSQKEFSSLIKQSKALSKRVGKLISYLKG